ncbi:hypothetical protein D3C81_2047490 [compost metagenome]
MIASPMLATGTFSVSKNASPDSCNRWAPALMPPLNPPWDWAISTCARALAMLAAATRSSVLALNAWRTSSLRR